MSWTSFRLKHLHTILSIYEHQKLPIDQFLQDYFRSNKSIGSKDRVILAEGVYGMTRWKGLFEALLKEKLHRTPSQEEVFEFYLSGAHEANHPHLAPHLQVSFPKILFDLIQAGHGVERALELGRISNQAAPVTVRANRLKISRDELLERWKAKNFPVTPTSKACDGIFFSERAALFELPEFKEGLFEMQDEHSQLIGELVAVQSGEQVLDYCAGSGGKALAIGAHMAGKGQLYLHDIRLHALQDARKRLARAGVQNIQILPPGHAQWQRLVGKMDWILVDAPCTGTGTLRRNPDMKWRFTLEMLNEVRQKQREVMKNSLRYLKPNGKIVYATCSILPEENEEQVKFFCQEMGLEVVGEPLRLFPIAGGGDGFYGAVLKKEIKPR